MNQQWTDPTSTATVCVAKQAKSLILVVNCIPVEYDDYAVTWNELLWKKI